MSREEKKMPERDSRIHDGGIGGIVIEVSADEMEAYLVCDSLSEAETPLAPMIEKALAEKGITYGIRKDVIQGIKDDSLPEGKILIAEGLAPRQWY